MIRIIYRDDLSGELSCSLCGQSIELPGNVRAYSDEQGTAHTFPNARSVVYAHFYHDDNAHIETCTARLDVGTTPWEAVSEPTGAVVARGHVDVPLRGHVMGPIVVRQDEP